MSDYRSIWKYLYKTPHVLSWVDVKGVPTRYLEAGPKDAPPVIMLHGLMGSLENFSANISEHARHFHVYAIDMIGCGWTGRPDYPLTAAVYVEHLRGFMDAMGISSAGMIGVSLGSLTAAYFTHAYPDRSEALVLVSPIGATIEENKQNAELKGAVQPRRDAVEDPTWERVRAVFKRLILHEENIVDDIVAIRQDIYRDPLIKERLPHLFAISQERRMPHEEWKTIQTPALVIGATDVDASSTSQAKLVSSLLPKATLVDMRGCNHWAQFERADIFNPLSIEFLTEHLRKRAARSV